MPVLLTFMVTGTCSVPRAGICLPTISMVVHWQLGTACCTVSGFSVVFTSVKLPSSTVCGATMPKSSPAGSAITFMSACVMGPFMGLPTGFTGAAGGSVGTARAGEASRSREARCRIAARMGPSYDCVRRWCTRVHPIHSIA